MLNLLAETGLNLGKAGNGIFVFILGLLVVFFGMIVIVLAITIAGKAVNSKNTEPKKKASVEKTAEPVAVAQPVVEEGIPEHVRVAIIAAIAAYYDGNGNAQPDNREFKVRKIKKLNR